MRSKFNDIVVYNDEDGNKVSATVQIIEETISYVKFKTLQTTILTIPLHRVLKIKRRANE